MKLYALLGSIYSDSLSLYGEIWDILRRVSAVAKILEEFYGAYIILAESNIMVVF
jgi:hypothetical protein